MSATSNIGNNLEIFDDGKKRDATQETLYVLVDAAGFTRNIVNASDSAAKIFGPAITAAVIGVAAAVFVPFSLMFGGAITIGSAVRDDVPKALSAHLVAHIKLTQATETQKRITQITQRNEIIAEILARVPESIGLDALGIPLLEEPMDQNLDSINRLARNAQEGLTVARLTTANASLYLTMGFGLLASGIIDMMSAPTAHVLGYAAAATVTAVNAAMAALGLVYLIRGPIVVWRALYNLSYLNAFDREFRGYLDGIANAKNREEKEKAINDTIAFVENMRQEDPAALERKIGSLDNLPAFSESLTPGEKVKYLEVVEQGIHKKKLQQKLNIMIGVAMTIGGMVNIVAAFFSGGLSVVFLSLASAIFFSLMEGIYACYDSSSTFEKLRAYCYTESETLLSMKTDPFTTEGLNITQEESGWNLVKPTDSALSPLHDLVQNM